MTRDNDKPVREVSRQDALREVAEKWEGRADYLCRPDSDGDAPTEGDYGMARALYACADELRSLLSGGGDADGWLQAGSTLYRLTDDRRPVNRDMVTVQMADGSHSDAAREALATRLLSLLSAAPAHAVEREAVAWRVRNYDPILAGGFAWSVTFNPADVTPDHEPLYATPPAEAREPVDPLVEEGLAYFEKSGDAGDKLYVAAIRRALAGRTHEAREPVGDDDDTITVRLDDDTAAILRQAAADAFVTVDQAASVLTALYLRRVERQAAAQPRDTPRDSGDARDNGYSDGILFALSVIAGAGDMGSPTWEEILYGAEVAKVIRRAVEEGELELSGIAAYLDQRDHARGDRARAAYAAMQSPTGEPT
jgi:hypothetical protein